jgi:hypothetical protein
LLVRALTRDRVFGDAVHALAGEITDHPAPGLVVVVELIDRRNSEGHRGNEGKAGGQHAEYHLLGECHPDEQCPECHQQEQEEPGSLRFKHSVLLAGDWSGP